VCPEPYSVESNWQPLDQQSSAVLLGYHDMQCSQCFVKNCKTSKLLLADVASTCGPGVYVVVFLCML